MRQQLTIISDVGTDPAAAAMNWLAQPEPIDVAEARAAGRPISYEWSFVRGDHDRAAGGHLVVMAFWTGGYAVMGRWAWDNLGALETASRIAYALKATGKVMRFAPLYPTQIVREHGAAPSFENAFIDHTTQPVDIEDAPDGSPRFRYRCACGEVETPWYATEPDALAAHTVHRQATAAACYDQVAKLYPIPSAV
jgi:hypothetical protein